jgi:hypothetical protein
VEKPGHPPNEDDSHKLLLRHLRGVARTLLHVVTDWPGYLPNGPRTVERLLAAGADPDAATTSESP